MKKGKKTITDVSGNSRPVGAETGGGGWVGKRKLGWVRVGEKGLTVGSPPRRATTTPQNRCLEVNAADLVKLDPGLA